MLTTVVPDYCVSAMFLAPVQAMDGMVEVLLGRQAKDAEHGLGVLSRLPAEKVSAVRDVKIGFSTFSFVAFLHH